MGLSLSVAPGEVNRTDAFGKYALHFEPIIYVKNLLIQLVFNVNLLSV